MKKEGKQMLQFTTAFTWVLLVVCVIMCAAGVPLARQFLTLIRPEHIHVSAEMRLPVLLVLGYGCGAALIDMLVFMLKLLRNLEQNHIFEQQNIHDLSVISNCCVLGALLTFAIGMLYDETFLIITICACFMAAIVRVIRSLFQKAEEMKDELDLTI